MGAPGTTDKQGRGPRLQHFSAAIPTGRKIQSLKVGNVNRDW